MKSLRLPFLATGVAALLGVLSLQSANQSRTIADEDPQRPAALAHADELSSAFRWVARKTLPSVVSVRTIRKVSGQPSLSMQEPFGSPFGGSPLDDLFGDLRERMREQQGEGRQGIATGEGSGFIISKDGLIMTNSHVVRGADEISVRLQDGREFTATDVRTDEFADVAVMRIKTDESLPALKLGDDAEMEIGDWVMAFGSPFGLDQTVTQGIISAKSRGLKNLPTRQEFLQTDAAINPGNSGGALVNLNGGLIGINTAIASPTGSYSGYGFAVPANIVSKIVNDLIEYGTVQRGFLGVTIRTVDAGLARDKGLKIIKGVYVDSLMEGSSAAKAGVKSGDVIVQIDGQNVTSSPELQEIVARHRPGDQLSLKVNRNGAEKSFSVTLNNRKGNTELAAKADDDDSLLNTLGVELEEVPSSTAKKLGISGGLRVTSIGAGKIRKNTQMQEGFIITRVDGKPVATQADLLKALKGKSGGVMLEGKYEDVPGEYYYAFGM